MKRKGRSVLIEQPPAISPASDSRRTYFVAAVALVLLALLAFYNFFSTGFALDNQMLMLGDSRIQTASALTLG